MNTSPTRTLKSLATVSLGEDAQWYKDAVIYELRVRSFFDSDGDGIGDFRGLTEKLDYLADLGVTALWLLPFYPSPMRDDGYDIADYRTVHPSCGTLEDFKEFLRQAHARSLRVITELVINHTSDQHPWFQRARRAPVGSRYRDYYVWSDDPGRYADARIIFTDYEPSNWTWDPVAGQYYWHRFFAHQPDLNFENPEVCEAVMDTMDYWFELGVDGLRLDAIPYLFEREGTSCENLPETHAFLKRLRARVDAKFKGKMLLAEANQWPEDAVTYFGQGDECHMAFHFPIMPRLYMALRMEDHHSLLDIIDQTPRIPENCQWAIFLRNHDELTLEMVTDEERDYMVKAYAEDPQARVNLGIRRRLAPLLEGNRDRIELMNALLFSMPGTPVLYYGDELGMGDNVYLGDRNGVRTPMQWTPDRNGGFSRANPQKLFLPLITDPEYHFQAVNVENQQSSPSSLLWWTKRLIALRKQHPSFGRGSFEALRISNRRVLAFLRRLGDEVILVVANLSSYPQPVQLDLKEFVGFIPRELFGKVGFPPIREDPYWLTLGPHGFYWLGLEAPRPDAAPLSVRDEVPLVEVESVWAQAFDSVGHGTSPLEVAIARHIERQSWFPRTRRIRGARVQASFPLGGALSDPRLVVVNLERDEGDPDTHVIFLGWSEGSVGSAELVARVRMAHGAGTTEGSLVDVSRDATVVNRLIELVCGEAHLEDGDFRLTARLEQDPESCEQDLRAAAIPLRVRRHGVTFAVGNRSMVKVLHRLDGGESPEVELLRELGRTRRELVPGLVGALRVGHEEAEPSTVAIVQTLVESRRDAWSATVDDVHRFYERVLTTDPTLAPTVYASPYELIKQPIPEVEARLLGGYAEVVRAVARRLGELHLALTQVDRPEFVPQRWTLLDRRSFYQNLRGLTQRAVERLRAARGNLGTAEALAREVLEHEGVVFTYLRRALEEGPIGRRVRVHMDCHLETVLLSTQGPIFVDFVGDPDKTLQERRRKRSTLVDVASLVRSLHYAAYGSLLGLVPRSPVRPEDIPRLEPWVHLWYGRMAAAFIESYRETLQSSELVPKSDADFRLQLDLRILERAFVEVLRELEHRPSWAEIPLRAVRSYLGAAHAAE
jgi:maltose alpha-D-glucosyltransferase/alpha-amylase